MTSIIYRESVAPRKLVWVGPLTIVVTAIANLIIHTMAVAFFGVPATFPPLQAPTVIGSTIIYLLLALLAFLLVSRFARHPIRFYCILVPIALGVSILAPVMALAGLFPTPGMNIHIFWTMIAMHIVSASIVLSLLTTLTRKSR
jgi:Family of unknown function (DUF6069)